jgi:2-iminobutanoate/2-iminopropanoate deaminase
MARQAIHTAEAPASPLYSQGIKVGSLVYVTGTPGIDPATGELAGPTIQEQTRQALANCENILRAGGAGRENVAEVHVLLANPGDFAAFNEAYAGFFAADPPTRYCSKLGVAVPGMLVSIKMTAVID